MRQPSSVRTKRSWYSPTNFGWPTGAGSSAVPVFESPEDEVRVRSPVRTGERDGELVHTWRGCAA